MTIQFILAAIISAVISYLLGSLNSAIIVCKLWKKTDIRTVGSKNAGLTNTFRVFGKGPALVTLAGDLLKGVIAVLLSEWVFSLFKTGLPTASGYSTVFVGYVAGIFAILGHIWPVFYGFKGGKGILVSSSILLVIDPITFCIVIPFFALIVILTRYVSVASIIAAIAYPIITYFVQTYIMHYDYVWLHVILVCVTSAILISMHKPNIIRLMNGTENKFGKKKTQDNNKKG